MSKQSMVYRKEEKIYIFKELENGTYLCTNDDRIYESLDGFEAVNELLFEKQENLKCKIDGAIDKIDFKLEH